MVTPHDTTALTLVSVFAHGSHLAPPSRAETMRALRGERSLMLFRGDIESALFEAVRDKADVRFSQSIETIREEDGRVRVELADGTTIDGDLLIGADGLHSTVRRLWFGPEQQFRRGLGHVVAATMLTDAPAGLAEGSVLTLIAVGRVVTVANLGPHRTAVFFDYIATDPDAECRKPARNALAAAYGGFRSVLPDVHYQVGRAGPIYFDTISHIVTFT